jgi:hypothetical protein
MKIKSANKNSNSRKSISVNKNLALEVNQNTSCSITKIENGYLVSENGYSGKGKNLQYFNKQYYSPTNPVASVKFSGKK